MALDSYPPADMYAIGGSAASGGTPPSTLLLLLAHAPSVFEPVVSLGSAVLSRLELPADLRVLVTLRVAQELDAPYAKAQSLNAPRRHRLLRADLPDNHRLPARPEWRAHFMNRRGRPVDFHQ